MKTTNNSQSKIPTEAIKLLPWYATGWLSPKERTYVKKVLAEFPELKKLVANEHKMIQLIKQDESILEQSLLAPTEQRLEAVLNKLEKQSHTQPANQTISTKIKVLIEDFIFGDASKIQYVAIATISTLSIALLLSFISPLMKENNIFHPATLENPRNNQSTNITVLLVGLNTDSKNPSLVKLLEESHAIINAVPGKDGMYRIQLPTKLDPNQTEKLISKLSKHKELFWFAGEAY